jgi:DNA-binding NarL/FixJ family response regulator
MRVLLVDDHALFREGIAMLLSSLAPTESVLEADSFESALELLSRGVAIDLVLMDLALPGTSGLDGIARLKLDHPGLPVVALSSSDDRESVLSALDAGAMGYIPKSASSGVLMGALKLVMANGIYLPPSAFIGLRNAGTQATTTHPRPSSPRKDAEMTPADLGLTVRQTEVLFLILQGKPAKLISRELGLAASTVKSHTTAVLRALNVTTRTQAVIAAGKLALRFPSS